MAGQFQENSLRNPCLAFIQLSFNFLQRVRSLIGKLSAYYARETERDGKAAQCVTVSEVTIFAFRGGLFDLRNGSRKRKSDMCRIPSDASVGLLRIHILEIVFKMQFRSSASPDISFPETTSSLRNMRLQNGSL
ncbi:hypothetical protein TNCV_2573831 [Trichonephila clavipes]|nr:hypothetical protein TNCV_2573831 [Trichonephila clavipes]